MNTEKILIVDDQPSNLVSLVDYIESSFPEIEVSQALDGKMALYVANAVHPSLIITDWEMPGMNGIELIRELKEDEVTRDIPVIMCTGIMTSQDSLKMALEAGAVDYIRKPVDPVELEARVRSMLALIARNREILEEKQRHAITLLELEKEKAERVVGEALKEKEQAEASEQLKKRFFSQITHEFRTPLTLIQGPLEEITQQATKANIRRFAEQALRNSRVLLRLINQLLELARIDAGHHSIQPERIELMGFIRANVMLFEPLGRGKNLTITVDQDRDSQLVDVDPQMMTKVLNNLLSNAVKFTPKGGQIKVICGQQPGDETRIRIAVKDTGIGIPEEKLPFIFDRFYQVDHQKSNEMEGTGLGLSLVRELVELHQGEIKITSIPDLGTEVSIHLPLAQEGAIGNSSEPGGGVGPMSMEINTLQFDPTSIEDDTLEEGKGDVILIVEDNYDVRGYIRQILGTGYQILEAGDGITGIEKARQEVPDLIISDVMMPGANGYEVCQSLKQDVLTSHIPVILLTAKSSMEDKVEGLETGADDYLSKPFNSIELLSRIRNLISNRQRLQDHLRKSMVTIAAPIGLPSQEEQFMTQLRTIMEENLANESFSSENLAEMMAMSRSQLFRKLKALIDQSAGEFMRNYRLEKAYQMLEKNVAPIGEIAFMVGFSSSSYFSKSFSAKYGVSPKEVRNKRGGD